MLSRQILRSATRFAVANTSRVALTKIVCVYLTQFGPNISISNNSKKQKMNINEKHQQNIFNFNLQEQSLPFRLAFNCIFKQRILVQLIAFNFHVKKCCDS